jgi:RHS repeat-associated protein
MGAIDWQRRTTFQDDRARADSPRGNPSWFRILVGVLILAVVSAVAIQNLPFPAVGTAKAGAAVTPLPTPNASHGGRVPPAKKGSGGFEAGPVEYGLPKSGATKIGCWGANYVGVAYAPGGGTWSATASGIVDATGTAQSQGSMPTSPCTNQPMDSITATPDHGGYWMATGGGGVFSFGDAGYHGSMVGTGYGLAQGTAVVAVVADNGTDGYWEVDELGQVYSFPKTGGGAQYYGGALTKTTGKLAEEHLFGDYVVAMVSTPSGHGYWMVTNYGTVFAFGDALMAGFNHPGTGSAPYDWYAGIAAGPAGGGFYLVRMFGTLYAYGATPFTNPTAGHKGYFYGMAGTTDGHGYVILDTAGQHYALGDAKPSPNPPFATTTPPKPPPPPPPAGSTPEQTQGGGNSATNHTPPCAGAPVNCESGNEWETDTDVTVPGLGEHLDLNRTYNSDADTLGIFGAGWSSSYAMSAAVTPTTSTMVTQGNGSTVTFYTNGTGAFVPPKGTLATLSRNRTGGYTFRMRNTTTYTFNAYGRLVAEQDRNGVVTSLAYNTRGQLTTVTDASGRTITFVYNATGLVSQVTNPVGQHITYAYTNYELVSVTDPAGRVTRYAYDASRRLVSETSPTGGVATTSYNAADKVTKQTDAAGLTTTWSYSGTNATSGTTTITGPTGSVTKETFTKGNMVTKMTAYGTSAAATWHYTYTPTTFGVTSVTDPNGNTTRTVYNTTGDPTSVTDNLGQTTTTTYNSFNEPLVTVDPLGITTTNTYDAHGNLTKKAVTADSSCTSHCTQTTTYNYCATATCNGYLFSWHAGELETSVAPDGNETFYLYDSYGDVEITVDYPTIGQPYVTEDTVDIYNVLGEKTCQESPTADARGINCPAAGGAHVAGTTSWTYDADGEVTSQTNAVTKTGTTAYVVLHGTGTCTATIAKSAYCKVTTDPLGNKSVTYYDQDGRQVAKVTGAGSSTASTSTTAYDIATGTGTCHSGVSGAATCQVTTNGDGQATVAYRNVVTETVETVALGGKVATITYDGTSNQLTTTTAAGTTTDGYDKDNRLTSITYSNTASGYAQPANATYTYDADGNRTSMTDGTGTTHYTVNGFGQLASDTNGAGSTVSYGYNADGEVTSITYPNGKPVSYTYNGVGQMTSVTDFQGRTSTFTYDTTSPTAGGAQVITSTPDLVTTTTTANAAGEETSISARGTVPAPWSIGTAPVTPGPQIEGVSCPSATLCVAVDDVGDVLTSTTPANSSGWTITRVSTEPLNGVSCPTTTLCVAVGFGGTILHSTNPIGGAATWHAVTVGSYDLTAISCASATLCAAGTSTGTMVSTKQPTGAANRWFSTSSGTSGSIVSLTCRSGCRGINAEESLIIGSYVNSTDPYSWTTKTNYEATSVSCAHTKTTTTTTCALVDYGRVYVSRPWGGTEWTTTTAPKTTTYSQADAVTCPNVNWCEATGSNSSGKEVALGSYKTGKHKLGWHTTTTTDPTVAGSLSCPTTTLCVGLARDGQLQASADPDVATASWSTVSPYSAGGSTALQGVSCPTATLCVAVSAGRGVSYSTNPSTSRSWTTEKLTGTGGLNGVSCPSATLCVAVDADGDVVTTTNPEVAGDWHSTHVDGMPLTGVMCRSTTYCMAVDDDGHVLTSTNPTGGASAWSSTDVDGTVPFNRVSCNATTCAVAGNDGTVAVLRYGTWTVDVLDGSTTVNDVSCPSGTTCVAVDAAGDVLSSAHARGGVTAWTVAHVDSVALTGISCPSTTLCMAADADGNVAAAINPIGGVPAWRVSDADGTVALRAVSCPTKSFCELIGGTRQVIETAQPAKAAPDFSETYHYNAAGEVSSTSATLTSQSQQLTGTSRSTWSVSDGYTYDANDQVTGLEGNSHSFTYDAAGNPTSLGTPYLGSVSQTFNTADEVTTQHTGSSTVHYAYNSAGDRTSMTITTTTETTSGYNQANEMVTTTVAGHSRMTYAYNGDGLRMSMTVGTTSQQFAWDTQTGTPRILVDGTDNFIYGPDGFVLEQEDDSSTGNPLFFTHDELGSTRELINGSGTVVKQLSYYPYGLPEGIPGTNPMTPIGFAGAFTDPETGYLYLVNRYYDPGTDQFLTVDPDVGATYEPYEYATDDPVSLADPSGNATCGSGAGPRKVLTTYQMKKAQSYGGGYRTATLYCGQSGPGGYGYRHITTPTDTHVSQAKVTWNWFNKFMSLTLRTPDSITYQSTNETYKYSTYVQITTTWTHLTVAYSATFIVIRSAKTASIITAYARTPRWGPGYTPETFGVTFDLDSYGCGGGGGIYA